MTMYCSYSNFKLSLTGISSVLTLVLDLIGALRLAGSIVEELR